MFKDIKKIKYGNLKIWLKDQLKRKVGKEKVMYNTVEGAKKAAEAMSKKRGVHFSYYKCLFCDGYHVGKNRDNKIEGYDNKI